MNNSDFVLPRAALLEDASPVLPRSALLEERNSTGKFADLDAKMRAYEEAGDVSIVPDLPLVIRLDGRSFTRLTRQIKAYEAPFDRRFHEAMIATCAHCMDMGFRTVFGHTHSDEISILLHPADQAFDRKVRKLISLFAAEASAVFSLQIANKAVFDARICQLPDRELIVQYFRWRHEDANRNALNSYCYWTLRKEGMSAREVTTHLSKMSVASKNELLFARNINYNEVPSWQKRGTALLFEEHIKTGVNPITNQTVSTSRRRITPNSELPMGEAFSAWVRAQLEQLF